MGKYDAKEIYDDLKKTYVINEAFSRWSDYRARITDYICKNTKEGGSIAIIGVGEANDLDLSKIYAHSHNLTLFDIDVASMSVAINKYQLNGKNNVRCIACDLFGATEEDYINLINIVLKDIKKCKKLHTQWSPFISAGKYKEAVEALYTKINANPIHITDEKFDYIIMIGVHSQINAFIERIWNLFLQAHNSKQDVGVAQMAHNENEIHIPRINQAILDITEKRLFIGLEQFENGRDCSVQGAIQCFDDLYKRKENKDIAIDSVYQDIWSLLPDVSYNMGIMRVDIMI